MGFLSKAWKSIKKGWDKIDDYAVPIIGGMAIGALTGGFGAGLVGSLTSAGAETAAAGAAGTAAASAGIFSGSAALVGGGLGALQGAQIGSSKVQAKKAEKSAAEAAERQERMANSAATAVTPTQTSTVADTADGYANARRRRYSHSKTTNSGLGLSRYASATTKRSTLG